MQALGWQYYLLTNAMGSPMYPAGTNVSLSFSCLSTHNLPFYRSTSNHLRPFLSPTKGKELSRPILVSPSCHPSSTSGRSKLGLATSPSYISSLTWYLNSLYMFSEAVKLTVSLQLSNHWIVMLTYLHHSDPTIAHYRNKQWSFLRGAISTVDRPLLGWAGRFFLHNVSHDHVAHHLFSSIPFCAWSVLPISWLGWHFKFNKTINHTLPRRSRRFSRMTTITIPPYVFSPIWSIAYSNPHSEHLPCSLPYFHAMLLHWRWRRHCVLQEQGRESLPRSRTRCLRPPSQKEYLEAICEPP